MRASTLFFTKFWQQTWLILYMLLPSCSFLPSKSVPSAFQHKKVAQQHEIAFLALQLVDTPYRWGGNTPESGFDCSGLIQYLYATIHHLSLPRTVEQLDLTGQAIPLSALQTGDLVFFRGPGEARNTHAGVYIGQQRFVHAPRTGGLVRLESLSQVYWQRRFQSARRVL